MKYNYHPRHFVAFLSFFCCFSLSLFAQGTSPEAQILPYSQDFSTLSATAATYPAGFQGWTASVVPGSSYNSTATLVGDKSLTASGTASSTGGNVYNYNGKIGFLNTGSFDLTLGFAFKTVGQSGITVQYDAMVIRNPYNGTTNDRINELAMQYRIGDTTSFITLSATAYLSNTIAQSTGTAAVNPQTIKVQLPAECDNKTLIQIRWISKQNSGGGSRPSFAIDNLSVINDVIPPANASGYPKISDILSGGFDFSSQLDEIGKTYFVLLPAGSVKPSAAQIKAGTNANDTAASKTGVLLITDPTVAYLTTITGLDFDTDYVLYSISEDATGNTQADSNKFDLKTSSVPVPSITTTKTTLDFGFVEQNFASNALKYQIQALDLKDAVTLTASANFTISKSETTGFQSSIVFASQDFDNNTSPMVYVKFTPNAAGAFSGEIIHSSTSASNKIVALSGMGINPYIQNFNDANVLTNSGWSQNSVTGTKIKWISTTTRFNSSPAAVQINGYSETGASKDWLISPKLRLDNFDKFPLLSFYSRKFYAGTPLKLMVSTDYDGVSSPETANWTALEGDFPTTTGIFKQSQYINLQAYKTSHTYVAWVYESATSGGTDAAEWTVDDVSITNDATFLASNPTLDFGEVDSNTVSPSKAFVFMAGGYGDVAITAPFDYQLSVDNFTFQSDILISAADAEMGKTIYARFEPSSRTLTVTGTLTVVGTGLNQKIGSFSGSSLPKIETFDIVSYNLEFFGSNVIGADKNEFGPINDALQVENVAKVMNTLNADVYVVQEISDEPSLETLIQKISINGKTFDKTISPAWSYSFNAPQADFPPQKLVVLYNTKTATIKKTRVMFSKLFDDIRAGKTTLPNYPGGSSASFFSSGRLPYMVEIETNINGVKKDVKIVDLHARANSGSDMSKYNMRKYDSEFLKDSLDVNYPDTNLMILGDYNDDVDMSVIVPNPSSYHKMVEDTARYNTLTLEISKAGAFSYLSSGGFLDHIIISNELTNEYVPNSTEVYDPRMDVANYVNTTSDHGPVIARFDFKTNSSLSTNGLTSNGLSVVAYPNPTSELFNVVINSENTQDLKLNIYDILGRPMGAPIKLKNAGSANTTRIDIGKLPKGIYIYTLSNGYKVVFKDKIVKK